VRGHVRDPEVVPTGGGLPRRASRGKTYEEWQPSSSAIAAPFEKPITIVGRPATAYAARTSATSAWTKATSSMPLGSSTFHSQGHESPATGWPFGTTPRKPPASAAGATP